MGWLPPRPPVADPARDPLPPDPLPIAGGQSPCSQYSCRACCFDTRMPLTQADLARLEQVTGKNRDRFSVGDEEDDGPRRLKNADGHCVFLEADGCGVYNDRPSGCRIYPLVLDPETGQGVLDDDCPYTKGFRVRPRDRAALAGLVTELGLQEK